LKEGGKVKDRGITLVELIVVISIISILLVLSYFSYDGWMARYKVEKATKELYADMMHARMKAMSRGRDHYMVMDQASYTMYEDRNDNGDPDADEVLPAFPKKVEYRLKWNGTGKTLTFNSRGLVTSNRTVWFETAADPDYDCMRVSRTRIIMGKIKYKENGDINECEIK